MMGTADGPRCLQDFEYTNDSHHQEEHYEDAEADDDFKSVNGDLEQRHAEGAFLQGAAFS